MSNIIIQEKDERLASVTTTQTDANLDNDQREVFSLTYIYALLQALVNTKLEMAISAEKAQQVNVEGQNKLNEALAACKLKSLPKDAWQIVPHHIYQPDTIIEGDVCIHTVRKITDHMTERLVHPSKLMVVEAANNKQLKIRQDIQNSLAIFQQKGNVQTTGVETNTKSSAETMSEEQAFVNILWEITKKIEGKRD